MRIDAYTHFMPKRFFDEVLTTGDHRDIGKRVREIPSIHDLDVRLKIIDSFPDYAQIISYPMPPLEVMTQKPEQVEEYARIVNAGFAELCAKHPDHFPGFVAQAPPAAPDSGVREASAPSGIWARWACRSTPTSAASRSTVRVRAVLRRHEPARQAIWLHPARRQPSRLCRRKKSLYEIWWTFGWSYETAAAMRAWCSQDARQVSQPEDHRHHFGGIVPMVEGRSGPGWDQRCARTSDEDYVSLRKSMKKRPLDYFKQDFYTDTAVFGSRPATVCGLEFFPREKTVFASDCPFDPEKGTMYIRETLKILDGLDLSKQDRDRIYRGNLEALVGKKFA